MEIKPNVVAMEILAYLAYETVAQLVDLALLMRQDMVTKAGDPFSHAISATFIQYHSSAEGSCLRSYPDSPENTPPPKPSAPSSGSQLSGRTTSGSLGNGSAGQDSAKTKQRKRKKVSDIFSFSFFFPLSFFFLVQGGEVLLSMENVFYFSHKSDF